MSPVVNTVRKTDARPDPSALVSFGPAGPHWVRSGRAIRLKNQRFDDFVFNFSKITGAPEEIRTPDPQIRSLVFSAKTGENPRKTALAKPLIFPKY